MKRKIRSSEESINAYNSKQLKIQENENLSLLSNLSETKKIKLSVILNELKQKLKVEKTIEGLALYKLLRSNGKSYQVIRNYLDISALFDPNFFSENFKLSFGYDFNHESHSVRIFPNIKLILENDLSSRKSNILQNELADFRFVVCFVFGLIFNINLNHCECHPTTFQDFILLDAGVSKNCISNKCKNILEFLPNYYDALIHFDCSSNQYHNLMFTFLNLVSTGDVKVNITSKQLIN